MTTTKINTKKRFFVLPVPSKKTRFHLILYISLSIISVFVTLLIVIILILSLIVTLAYPKLPELDTLIDYRPKIPLRIFSADGILIGEFGEERRDMVHIQEIPELMKKAVLSIEDDRFYEHNGVDYQSILRAFFTNLSGSRGGASTITQQVARNFFLTSNEPTFLQKVSRKFYEIPLAWKIECNLTKTQILEVYMNQIYLGQRAYGFATAAQIYFGKKLKELSIAEAAMLAGLPKAPSTYNPVVNPKRAYNRQQYILLRMYQLKHITDKQYQQAKKEQLKIKNNSLITFKIHAEYVSEMARQLVYTQFKEDTYTRGLNVFTTITKTDQDAAYLALRYGILDYERRRSYRTPQEYIKIPLDAIKITNHHSIETKFTTHNDALITAIVIKVTPQEITAILKNGYKLKISSRVLGSTLNLFNHKKEVSNTKVKQNTIIRIFRNTENWIITKMPEVQSAFISINPNDGAIRSLVGGCDFNHNKFNHVTQAWRQPGSSFKPFIYSSSLEKGLSPATIINDAPLTFTQTSGLVWQPKNYGGKFEGPISMRRALQKSINLVSIRILEYVGVKYAQQYLTRFGFDAEKNPPYLTLALGSGAVTPLQMVSAYSIFANGGYKINPYLISKITDNNGKILAQAQPIQSGDENNRVIDPRNAFVIDNMLRDVVRHGTAYKAKILKRSDLAGKTGTTNDAMDAWFAGYQPNLVAIAWMGYDQPKSLGDRETGGGLALPIWINYMQKVLKNIPIVERTMPNGLVEANGDYYYAEYLPDNNVNGINLDESINTTTIQKYETKNQI